MKMIVSIHGHHGGGGGQRLRFIRCFSVWLAWSLCPESSGFLISAPCIIKQMPLSIWQQHEILSRRATSVPLTTSSSSSSSMDPINDKVEESLTPVETTTTTTTTTPEEKPKKRKFDTPTNDTYNFWEEDLTIESFNMDLQNLATEDPYKAKDALEIMSDMFGRGLPSTVEPDCRCYNTVIDGFIQAGYPEEAQELLDEMERLADVVVGRKNASVAAPSEYTYMMVAQAWADDVNNDVSGKSAERAERLMRRMQERGLPPNVKVWSIVLEGWCKRAKSTRSALLRAESLLTEMERAAAVVTTTTTDDTTNSCTTLTTAPPPNIVTYTSYIGGLARSKDRSLARKADATLARMERAGIPPDVVAYTSVINCWAKAVNRREREMAASRALRILDEMERRHHDARSNNNNNNGDSRCKPNLISYATAIRAVGNSLDRDAAAQAQGVLRRLYELHQQAPKTYGNLKPTTAIYNAVINALSRAPVDNPGQRIKLARKAEQYMAEMQQRTAQGERDVEPDVRTYAAVLRSWAMSGASDAADNAQRVLDQLERLFEQGKTSIRPNYVCYTTVMGAWGHSRKPNALTRMEAILRHMERQFTETQQADVRPNTVSYVTAIDAFVRRNEWNAAQRAQDTVDRMMKLYSLGLGHVRPTRIVFNTLIHAWSKCGANNNSGDGSNINNNNNNSNNNNNNNGAEAAQRAEEIFKWMEAQYQAGDVLVRPDEVSLCAVLNAWANHAGTLGAQRAQQIFQHMQSLTLEQRGFHISIMTPNIVIKAIARSKDRHAVAMAEEMLIQLENDYAFGRSTLRPDVTTYSSVINCCAYHRHFEGQAEALAVALRTFRKLCDMEGGEGPNNITFGTLFKAIAHLMPAGDERDELVRSLFDKCCDEGFVDAFVLSQVKTASLLLFKDLMEEAGQSWGKNKPENEIIEGILESIPSEWSSNVLDY
ncbi:hypothetical protein ACA910_009517 [Epithemia clementina (nom. ined.)]